VFPTSGINVMSSRND